MSCSATNIVQLFPSDRTKHKASPLHRGQMDQDIKELVDLADRLQQMRAPYLEASSALIKALDASEQQVDLSKITSLGEDIETLEIGINALILAMSMHQHSKSSQDNKVVSYFSTKDRYSLTDLL